MIEGMGRPFANGRPVAFLFRGRYHIVRWHNDFVCGQQWPWVYSLKNNGRCAKSFGQAKPGITKSDRVFSHTRRAMRFAQAAYIGYRKHHTGQQLIGVC